MTIVAMSGSMETTPKMAASSGMFSSRVNDSTISETLSLVMSMEKVALLTPAGKWTSIVDGDW